MNQNSTDIAEVETPNAIPVQQEPPMFTEADRLRLFTRTLLEQRLGAVCSVEWLLREFSIPLRCKGRLIAGADIVNALLNPPTTKPGTQKRISG